MSKHDPDDHTSDSTTERAQVSQRFMGVNDAAAYSGLSEKSIRRLVASGKITGLRPVRGRVLIDRLELDSLILSADSKPRVGRGLSQ